MKDNNINSQDLVSLIARQNEVIKRVKNGGLDINDALAGTQGILDKILPPRQGINRFAEYARLLYPISKQAEYLRSLNKQMPRGMRVPDSWFTNLNTDSSHIQSVLDLEFFFVVPTVLLKEVIEYQIKLVELTQPEIWLSPDFISEVDGAYLGDSADKLMFAKPGIYRLRINLVSDNLDPRRGNYKARHTSSSGILLAGLAAVGAYAMQDPALYQSQDCENLLAFAISDIRSSDDKYPTLCSGWCDYDHVVRFALCGTGYVPSHQSWPSFV